MARKTIKSKTRRKSTSVANAAEVLANEPDAATKDWAATGLVKAMQRHEGILRGNVEGAVKKNLTETNLPKMSDSAQRSVKSFRFICEGLNKNRSISHRQFQDIQKTLDSFNMLSAKGRDQSKEDLQDEILRIAGV